MTPARAGSTEVRGLRVDDGLDGFRVHVRRFFDTAGLEPAADQSRDVYVTPSVGVEFQRRLFDAGLAGLTVPERYGGAGLDAAHAEVFNAEASAYAMPTVLFAVTIGMCVPVLLELGSEDQKRRHIPKMLRGDELWCQMFSEPEAGSDLASLRMSAARDGAEWVLDGQKVWTSAAQYAQVALCAARTDPSVPGRRGISLFIVPLPNDRVEVRPLVLMTGEARFNEVFCSGARIPDHHLLGEVNGGWQGITAMLRNERVALGASTSALVSGHAGRAIAAAEIAGRSDDPVVRDELTSLWIREQVLGYFAAGVRARASAAAVPGAEGSVAKLMGSELVKESARITADLAGAAATAFDPDDDVAAELVRSVLNAPSLSIGGGTSEIQRNIIAERLLGLPRDPHR